MNHFAWPAFQFPATFQTRLTRVRTLEFRSLVKGDPIRTVVIVL